MSKVRPLFQTPTKSKKQTIKTPGICSENKPNQVVFWRSPKSQLCKCTKIISQTFASSPFCHSAFCEVQGPRIWRAGTQSAKVRLAGGVGVHWDLCRPANLPANWMNSLVGTLASLSIAKPTRNVPRILHKTSDRLPHTYLGTEDLFNSESRLGRFQALL